jgi:outer membrane protein assembly factor BamB
MRREVAILAGAVLLVVLVAAGGYALLKDDRGTEKRGSANQEFDTSQEPEAPRKAKPTVPWPTYAFDVRRSHLATGFRHRPPYRKVWRLDGKDTLEFPPTVGYGRVFLAQQKGLFFAIDGKTGKVRWKRNFKRCAASSPTVGRRTVYQAYMDFVPCPQGRSGASGFVMAMNYKTGKRRWIYRTGPVESSPLLVKRTLYFGSWDHKVHAVNARTGRRRWAFQADEEVNTSAAYSKGTVFIASDAGTVYALDARTGRKKWSAKPSSEFFYGTATVAYGRVFIGNTDGTMYAFGARSGRLLWAKPLGTYIYAAAGVAKRRVFTGTYDGFVYSLNAATGDVVWRKSAPAAVHGAPTIMNGLAYFSTCSTCGSEASRAVKAGPDSTVAYSIRTGRLRWRLNQGKYASPVVADSKRVYLTGRSYLYALTERSKRRRRHR